ncbi:MAG: hypothetical protein WEB59_08980 [Thermoanaerobaculia bacterium]
MYRPPWRAVGSRLVDLDGRLVGTAASEEDARRIADAVEKLRIGERIIVLKAFAAVLREQTPSA